MKPARFDPSAPGHSVGMPTSATDLRYGRRGGRWLPPGYTEAERDRHCPVCDGLLTVGQDVHRDCQPDDDPPTLFD